MPFVGMPFVGGMPGSGRPRGSPSIVGMLGFAIGGRFAICGNGSVDAG
jgi:hypothetical protein